MFGLSLELPRFREQSNLNICTWFQSTSEEISPLFVILRWKSLSIAVLDLVNWHVTAQYTFLAFREFELKDLEPNRYSLTKLLEWNKANLNTAFK